MSANEPTVVGNGRMERTEVNPQNIQKPRKLGALGKMSAVRRFEPADLIALVSPKAGDVVDMDEPPPPWLVTDLWVALRLVHEGRRLRVTVATVIQDEVVLNVKWEDE